MKRAIQAAMNAAPVELREFFDLDDDEYAAANLDRIEWIVK